MKAGLLPAWAEGSCDGLSIDSFSSRISLCAIHTWGCTAVGWAVPLPVWLWDPRALPAGPRAPGEAGAGAQCWHILCSAPQGVVPCDPSPAHQDPQHWEAEPCRQGVEVTLVTVPKVSVCQ